MGCPRVLSEAKVPEEVRGCQDFAKGFDPQGWGGDALTPEPWGGWEVCPSKYYTRVALWTPRCWYMIMVKPDMRGRCQHTQQPPFLSCFTIIPLQPPSGAAGGPLPSLVIQSAATAVVRFKLEETLRCVTPWTGALGNNSNQ